VGNREASGVRGMFIAGTDTGVGKTVVTAGLAAALRSQGFDIGVWKPVQSGALAEEEGSDAFRLRSLSGIADECRDIAPLSFPLPLTPLLAAEREGVTLTLERIVQAGKPLLDRHAALLIEGAGGLAVPLAPREMVVDLIARLQVPVLLVARAGLGTINHTLLSAAFLRQRDIPVAGVILNGYREDDEDESVLSNAAMIERFGEVAVVGRIPWLQEPLSPAKMVEVFHQHADITRIRTWFE
jgi:dethiobiotin synthetase